MADKKIRKRAYIPPSQEVVNRKERASGSARPARGASRQTARPGVGNPRSANYVYPMPSVKRTAKRLPIYFVLIFGLQYWQYGNAKDVSDGKRLLLALGTSLLITIVFAPFMHWMDKLSYNRWVKRSSKSAA
jgi:hypothetical protein